MLLVFSHVLAGSLEPVTFRYFLLLSDFLSGLDWGQEDTSPPNGRSACTFMEWCKCVYSFMDEESLEQYSIEFTGHSSNNCNRLTILNYILWLIMRNKEPLISQVYTRERESVSFIFHLLLFIV